MTIKKCKTCQIEKELVKNRRVCLECARIEKQIINKKYNESEKGQKTVQIWRNDNADQLKIDKQQWYQDHRELSIQRAKDNKAKDPEHYNEVHNKNEQERRKIDPVFRLKGILRSATRGWLKGTKNGESIASHLPYTIQELKNHLESQFEYWMNWGNQGVYRVETWNDFDPTTWTWQLDHIMPQSDLPYTTMEEENFRECWKLSNLRPYSAKQNLLDGVSRIRHKVNK
jgi:hypothetical protein